MRRSILLVITVTLWAMTAETVQARIANGYSNIFTIDTVTAVEDGEGVPSVTVLSAIYPNPFNPQTTIEFALDEAGPIELAVFDLRGRLVKVLDRGDRSSGRYRATWNGRDMGGRLAPAGTYFCRLVASDETQTKKLTLAK